MSSPLFHPITGFVNITLSICIYINDVLNVLSYHLKYFEISNCSSKCSGRDLNVCYPMPRGNLYVDKFSYIVLSCLTNDFKVHYKLSCITISCL